MNNVVKKAFSLFLVGVVAVSMFGFIAPTRAEAFGDDTNTYKNRSFIDFYCSGISSKEISVYAQFFNSEDIHPDFKQYDNITDECGEIKISIPDKTKYVKFTVINGSDVHTKNFQILDEDERSTILVQAFSKQLGANSKSIIDFRCIGNCYSYEEKSNGTVILYNSNNKNEEATARVSFIDKEGYFIDNPVEKTVSEYSYDFISIPEDAEIVQIKYNDTGVVCFVANTEKSPRSNILFNLHTLACISDREYWSVQ